MRRTRVVASRAVRRLDVIEWVLLVGAVVVALGGGALVASLLATPTGVPFRTLWVAASLVLLVVPGGLALRRANKQERDVSSTLKESDG
jgi:uncharacterized membrane protein